MRIIKLGLIIFALLAANVHANSISDLTWLQGSWRGEFQGGSYETYFTSPGAGTILGIARQMDGTSSSLLFFEFTMIRETPTGFTISPMPFGQPGATLVSTEVKPGKLVFSNAEDKFPKQIVYELSGHGQLVVSVSGVKDNKPVSFEIIQNRRSN